MCSPGLLCAARATVTCSRLFCVCAIRVPVASWVSLHRAEFPDGKVGQSGFIRLFKTLIRRKRITTQLSEQQVTDLLVRLFTAFDRDHNGVVDHRELAAGLSVLCGSESTDRIRSAFELFDDDGNGFISLDEMQRYLTTVFSVISEINPALFEHHDVSAEELAEVTARRCFMEVCC